MIYFLDNMAKRLSSKNTKDINLKNKVFKTNDMENMGTIKDWMNLLMKRNKIH